MLAGSFVTAEPPAPTPALAPAPAVRADPAREEAFKQLPPAPTGFSWLPFKNAAVLRPTGWFDATLASTDTIPMHVVAISPEAFSKDHPFETGLTLQILENPGKRGNLDAFKAVLAYLRPFAAAHKNPGEVLVFDQQMRGEVQLTFFRYRDAPAGKKPVIVHKYIMASQRFDSLHIFTFESPEASWEENWKTFGTPILKMPVVFLNMPVSAN